MTSETTGPGTLFPMESGTERVTYPFLSPEWVEAARAIRHEEAPDATGAVEISMNLVVTQVPFGDSPVRAYLDTSEGVLALEFGQHPAPDLVVTVDWATAKALLVEGNTQAAMSAFLAGKVRVEGDVSKLLALQGATPGPASVRVVERLRALTA